MTQNLFQRYALRGKDAPPSNQDGAERRNALTAPSKRKRLAAHADADEQRGQDVENQASCSAAAPAGAGSMTTVLQHAGAVKKAAVVRASGAGTGVNAKGNASADASAVRPPGVQRGAAVGMPEKLGNPVQPLRMIIVGHNPSEETWRAGHAYAHRSNRMWPLLIKTGIAPAEHVRDAYDDDKMPGLAGVGFSDVGTGHPGTDSAAFASSVFVGWASSFYERMRRHIAAASAAIGCTCGMCGAPTIIAFAGKRQLVELLNISRKGSSKVKGVEFGKQDPTMVPEGWPFDPKHTEVWVCSSTSGASPMTNEHREAPWTALAQRLAEVAWPRIGLPRCQGLAPVLAT